MSNGVGCYDLCQFPFWNLSQIPFVETDLRLLFDFKPSNGGVIITFFNGTVVTPLLICLKLTDRFYFEGLHISIIKGITCDDPLLHELADFQIAVIGQSQTMIAVRTMLYDAEVFGVVEGVYVHLCDVIEEVLMQERVYSFRVQVDNVNSVVWYVQHDDLFLI